MTRLFRSKSCGVVGRNQFNPPTPNPVFQDVKKEDDDDEIEEEEEDEEEESESEDDESSNPVSTPFINPISKSGGAGNSRSRQNQNQFAILDMLMAALRKSLVTCSVERDDVSSLDISWPTEVRHVSHVTFDRFNGFLGLPTELEPEVPMRVPSASVRVFGVSAKSMQCSYDYRGNSVPTILLMMQKRLYSEGGLKAEGIFRINPENGQEEFVRDQLNRGVVPHGIDVHCLSGLIKAWFRELPTGVLDSLTPEQVMRCNTEDDCTKLEELLPPTEAALLDWAINLMADVAEHEQYNKMNARNIATVFAPNMTQFHFQFMQMADPLTALIHAVQVMNFLKTLILKTLREREESAVRVDFNSKELMEQTEDVANAKKSPPRSELFRVEQKLETPEEKGNNAEEGEFVSVSGGSTPCRYETGAIENRYGSKYDSEHWLRLRKGVRKLCRHPVFQLTKFKKSASTVGIVNTRARGGQAWA